jgi:hypothetical protein
MSASVFEISVWVVPNVGWVLIEIALSTSSACVGLVRLVHLHGSVGAFVWFGWGLAPCGMPICPIRAPATNIEFGVFLCCQAGRVGS